MDDLKAAMKAKDTTSLNVLRSLKSAIKYAAIEASGADAAGPEPIRRELDETASLAVVRKQIKQRQDSLVSFRDAGREDLAGKEEAEIKVLENYLPAGLSTDELAKLVGDVVAETGAATRKDMGRVMKLLQERAAGRADNTALSREVMKHLS